MTRDHASRDLDGELLVRGVHAGIHVGRNAPQADPGFQAHAQAMHVSLGDHTTFLGHCRMLSWLRSEIL
jgi:hypothetical protein